MDAVFASRAFEAETALREWYRLWRRGLPAALDGFRLTERGGTRELAEDERRFLLRDGRYLATTPSGGIDFWDLDLDDLLFALTEEGQVVIKLVSNTGWSGFRSASAREDALD